MQIDSLTSDFFDRSTVSVARDLLGTRLIRQVNDQLITLVVNEVEAYDGPHDRACHGRFGLTARTSPMFGPAGYWYVYLVYGMHWMLNVVTGPRDYPAAILIRGAGDFSGPGRLSKQLLIDRTFNSKLAHPTTGLWLAPCQRVIGAREIARTPRIGVDYAGPHWSKVPYRFVLMGSSKKG